MASIVWLSIIKVALAPGWLLLLPGAVFAGVAADSGQASKIRRVATMLLLAYTFALLVSAML
jgi:hypothetical protein